MILKAEVRIDLDDKRRICLELSAKPDEDDDIADVIEALARATADEGMKMANAREARMHVDPEAAKLARELRTFGDDEEDDD